MNLIHLELLKFNFMAHYAKITNNTVTQVIVAEEDFINFLKNESPDDEWIQTSYNTHKGVHILGGIPLRKNFAAIGYIYDRNIDAFIKPKPFDSWILDEKSCCWNPPIPYPDDGAFLWDENSLNWIKDESFS
jgi:hypothetical protein